MPNYTPRHAYFVPDQAAMDRLMFSWTGIPGRDLIRREQIVETGAKATVGVETAELQLSIGHERSVNRRGLETKIGSAKRHAAVHHQGSPPHVIRPRSGRRALRFRVAGRVVFASRVNHPGTDPNPYLTRWLREVV